VYFPTPEHIELPFTATNTSLTIEFAGQLAGDRDYDVDNAVVAETIPEPSTFALAAIGLLGLLACARRRRR